ncbi:GL25721 [Drosophila persimilis]|uniref:GL25721 n=1 Tax=Drosophila persimilis TaxID=7234 RepID=B4GK97_DROPE|nr:nucleolar protein dao-5 [Drosophila persimilis]XP_026843172.1 nucleolar protein dao-5 [Drosophila persimilis]EDW37063.1 GL25721 [Drosophila persimilis]
MGLKKALDDCLIDFDCRVMITDLLEEYKLSYKEVNDTLEAYIKEQEPATKFEKRFLVHGTGLTNGTNDEFYTIVQESKLEDWRNKLRDAQWQLYSVEIAGGSKSPATVFRPMQHLEVKLAGVKRRSGTRIAVDRPTNGAQNAGPSTNGVQKAAPALNGGSKGAAATNGVKSESVKPATSKENSETEIKKTSPKEQTAKGKPAKKGSINSFFSAAAAPAAGSKPKEVKATPSKANTMDNFFKKQPAGAAAPTAVKKSPESEVKKSPPIQAKKEPTANTSIQLFAEESAESSDEEEKLDKIRRKVMASDNESDQEKPSTSKRRRISDSDDDEQQPSKKNAEEEVVTLDDEMETEPSNETFLDDEGFVITQRKPTKQSKAVKKKASPPATKKNGSPSDSAPAAKKKSPPASTKVSKEAAKQKQGNIMSFFTKK